VLHGGNSRWRKLHQATGAPRRARLVPGQCCPGRQAACDTWPCGKTWAQVAANGDPKGACSRRTAGAGIAKLSGGRKTARAGPRPPTLTMAWPGPRRHSRKTCRTRWKPKQAPARRSITKSLSQGLHPRPRPYSQRGCQVRGTRGVSSDLSAHAPRSYPKPPQPPLHYAQVPLAAQRHGGQVARSHSLHSPPSEPVPARRRSASQRRKHSEYASPWPRPLCSMADSAPALKPRERIAGTQRPKQPSAAPGPGGMPCRPPSPRPLTESADGQPRDSERARQRAPRRAPSKTPNPFIAKHAPPCHSRGSIRCVQPDPNSQPW